MVAEEEEKPTPEELTLAFQGQGVDWWLQHLVSVANNSDIQIGITLFVEGAIVSGRLVGGKTYFETFAEEFVGEGPEDEDKESLRQTLARNGDIYTLEDDEDQPPPQFIHLIDSHCFVPGGQRLPDNRGVLWRGKISAVSGFSLGSLSVEKA